MKRLALLLSFGFLAFSSRAGLGQELSFLVEPQADSGFSCDATAEVAPESLVEVPLHLLISSDSGISGFTISLRVKSESLVTVKRDLSIRKAQFVELMFPEPPVPDVAGREIGDPFVPFVVDPAKDPGSGPLGGAPQGPGYTLGVVFFIGFNPVTFEPLAITLPPGERIIVDESLSFELTSPAAGEEVAVEIVYEDGLSGLGAPTGNVATINQQSVRPTLGGCTLRIKSEGGVEPTPIFDYGIEAPGDPIEVPAGEKGSATVYVTLDSQIPAAQRGIEGWQLSIGYGDAIDITSATINEEVLGAIPDQDDVDFNVPEFSVFDSDAGEWMGVDPTHIFEPGDPPDPACELVAGEPQGKGLVQGVVIAQMPDPEKDQDINEFQGRMLTLEIELAEPIGADETVTAAFEWKDCIKGSGIPIKSIATVGGDSVRPRNRTDGSVTFVGLPSGATLFHRGDANQDGLADLADAMFALDFLFVNGPAIQCLDSADANDDENINISDPITMILAEFRGRQIPAPHGECGTDDDQDEASCVSFDAEMCPTDA